MHTLLTHRETCLGLKATVSHNTQAFRLYKNLYKKLAKLHKDINLQTRLSRSVLLSSHKKTVVLHNKETAIVKALLLRNTQKIIMKNKQTTYRLK